MFGLRFTAGAAALCSANKFSNRMLVLMHRRLNCTKSSIPWSVIDDGEGYARRNPLVNHVSMQHLVGARVCVCVVGHW